jgi:hypothetical protein
MGAISTKPLVVTQVSIAIAYGWLDPRVRAEVHVG